MDPDRLCAPVTRLFPGAGASVPLRGLYLAHNLRGLATTQSPLVYTNFVQSLDGRVALKDPATGRYQVPPAIANPRDWRLFQELAAQADVLVTSGRYLRDLASGAAQATLRVGAAPGCQDLGDWRVAQGLAPQPAIAVVSASLELPLHALQREPGQAVYVLTGKTVSARRIARVERDGVKVLAAGDGPAVDGARMVQVLARLGFRTIYSTAGPRLLHTLLAAGAIDRVYLTVVYRVLGGEDFATLVTGPPLRPPAGFALIALYHDPAAPQGAGQCFASFERRSGGA